MPVFLPTIIKEYVVPPLDPEILTSSSMGYSSVTSQALSAPPYLVAFAVVLATTYVSDRNRSRSPYLIAHAVLSSVAYLAIAITGRFHSNLSSNTHIFIRYLCVYPATSGFFSAITLIITWTMDNRVAKEGKGASMAILNIIGQCGPLLGTRLYPDSDGPWYIRGMTVCAFFMAIVAVLALVLRALLQRANSRVRQEGNEIELEGMGWEEAEGLMGRNISRGNRREEFTFII